MAFVRHVLAAILSALLVSITGTPLAQPSLPIALNTSAPHIEAFDVERVARISAGVPLHFSLYGTPGGIATLNIEGARRVLDLRELQPGIYEGSYIVDARDRIAPDSQVTAALRVGEHVATAVLEERLLLGPDARMAEAPVFDSATSGSNGARARRPRAETDVPRDDARPLRSSPSTPACEDCAVVESIRPVKGGRGPGHLGLIAGGLLGAIFGDQVADPSDRELARIVGAIGGALAGQAVERNGRSRTQYDVLLRLPDGARLIRTYDRAPAFKVGDTIPLGVNLGGARRERPAEASTAGLRPIDPTPARAEP